MSRLMQSASALALSAVLAGAPVFSIAQQATESEAGQAVEVLEQETEEAAQAAGEALEATGEAIEEAAGEAGQAIGQAAEEVEQEAEQAGEAVEAEIVEGDAVEAEVVEGEAVEGDVVEGEIVEGEVVEGEVAEGEVVEGEEPVEEVEGAIVMQDENSLLTSDLVDASVYNATGEKIGEIDDAILSLDGMVEGVVIGVGGFLGIGEKHVAVEMQQLSLQTDEDGMPQLILDTTREALEAAPEFVTAEDQREEAERQAMQQAPAAGTAPVDGGMATSDQAGMTPPPPPAEAAPAGDAEAPKN